jgi:membrane protease YdiL (CAAX protease family)
VSKIQIRVQTLLSKTKKLPPESSADPMPQTPGIKPLPLGKTIIYGLLPAVSFYIIHYYLIPGYVQRSGVPYFKGYLVGYVLTMAFFFVAALIAYYLEGNPWTWAALKVRFRLAKMNKGDLWWVIALIGLVFLTYFGLGFTGNWVRSVSFLAPPESWPAELGPGGASRLVAGEFMGMPLKGQWWLVLVYFIGWFLNIFGEEFWFRGYILPRQELAFRSLAWLVNGLMFTFNHLWEPWILIAILPSSLLLAYVVQNRRNTWISIIQHGVVNISLLIYLIAGVIGLI